MLDREWLVTNGLGGYASSTVAGVPTRGYHGLLIASLPAPLGRLLFLGPLFERLTLADGTSAFLGGVEHPTEKLKLQDPWHLREFFLENGLPVWRYELNGLVVERRLWMPHCLNTVFVRYRLVQGRESIRLELQPGVHFRSYDAPVDAPLPAHFDLKAENGRVELSAPGDLPPLRMVVLGGRAAFAGDGRVIPEVFRRVEQARGYTACGALYSPGSFTVELTAEEPVTFLATCESWETLDALPPDQAEQAENERRERLLGAGAGKLADGLRRRAGAGGGPVHRLPGRPHGGIDAPAGGGGRGADDHRRLPLVHRLGPRHHDQPGGADADHGPARRGGLHPAHVRPPRPRRPHPQLFPRRQDRRASTTRPTRRCGCSTRWTATCRSAATARRFTCCCPRSLTSSSITCAGRASASASIRRTGCCGRGRRAIS